VHDRVLDNLLEPPRSRASLYGAGEGLQGTFYEVFPGALLLSPPPFRELYTP